MGPERKWDVIDVLRRSPLSKARTLEELGIPRSTYYRWQRRIRQQGEAGLVDRRSNLGTVAGDSRVAGGPSNNQLALALIP